MLKALLNHTKIQIKEGMQKLKNLIDWLTLKKPQKPTPSSVKMSLNEDITMEKLDFDKAALSNGKRS